MEKESQKSTSQLPSEEQLEKIHREELDNKLSMLSPGEELVDGDTTYRRLVEPMICNHDFVIQPDGTKKCSRCPQGRL